MENEVDASRRGVPPQPPRIRPTGTSRPSSRSPWLLVGGILGGTLLLFLACAGVVLMVVVYASLSGPAWQLAGTWVRVDQPPSPAAEALMSIGEVRSSESYVFSQFGSVVHNRYHRGAREPYFTARGSWRLAPNQDGDEGEMTVLLEFSDQPLQRVQIRFHDHRNAEFRTLYGDVLYLYKPR